MTIYGLILLLDTLLINTAFGRGSYAMSIYGMTLLLDTSLINNSEGLACNDHIWLLFCG